MSRRLLVGSGKLDKQVSKGNAWGHNLADLSRGYK